MLFVGLCSRSKGLFDAIEAVAEVNKTLAQRNSSSRVQLEVAGAFWRESEQREFEQRIRQSDLVASRVGRRIGSGATSSEGESFVRYHGFVSGAQKRKLLIESDCFCFPTCYPAESFGLVLLEAMAFDLPIITTSWRMIPEILPKDYPGIVSPQSPALIASAILTFMSAPPTLDLRAYFLTRFTDTTGLDRIRMVLGNVIAQADS